jgi:DNA repair protein RadC
MDRPLLGSWNQLLDYLRVAQGENRIEQFRLLFLDAKNRLIADEVHQTGTIDQTPVYPREVAKRALELGAAALIVVHNHPSGDPSPSPEDAALTRQAVDAGRLFGIEVLDHIVIGRGRYVSLKDQGVFRDG